MSLALRQYLPLQIRFGRIKGEQFSIRSLEGQGPDDGLGLFGVEFDDLPRRHDGEVKEGVGPDHTGEQVRDQADG